MFNRIVSFLYGVSCYAIFFVTFLYAIGFVGNIYVPKAIDSIPSMDIPMSAAILVNLSLLALFAIQHSVMARPAFKRAWTRIIPKHLERSTYTLLSSLALITLFYFWQPLGGIVWQVENVITVNIITTAFVFGWLLVLISTFLINHFDLFGLRQVWLHLRGVPYTPLRFSTPWLYKYVRHPLYVGWFFAFWATPTMTIAHLLFAVMTTAYILIAIQLEERDLSKMHPEYSDYKRRVPMLVPRIGKSTNAGTVNPGTDAA